MFGRKKKEADSVSVSMNESYTDNSDIPDEMIQKNYRQPVQQPQQVQYQNPLQMQPVTYNPMLPSLPQVQTQPIQQSMQQVQPMQMQQVQQVQRPRTAIIVKSELQDNGEFLYTVVANYQLSVGYARLEQ